MEVERIMKSGSEEDQSNFELSLRPRQFSEFPGQHSVKEKLKVFVEAAVKIGRAHV